MDLARMALERQPPKAVLLLMARNACTPLMATSTSPETVLAELPPVVMAATPDNEWR
jgi:hypothetical protein